MKISELKATPFALGILRKTVNAIFLNKCPSPDSSGILFLAPLERKRYSE